MGFNIAGLMVQQNYERNIDKLAEDLNLNLEVIEEISYGEASSNWTPEGEFRIYFSERETLIFAPHDWFRLGNIHSKEVDTLIYAYSATVMEFYLYYYKKGQQIRYIKERNGQIYVQQGEPLALEAAYKSTDSLILALFDEFLHDTFGGIDLNAKAYRCKLSKYEVRSYNVGTVDYQFKNFPTITDFKKQLGYSYPIVFKNYISQLDENSRNTVNLFDESFQIITPTNLSVLFELFPTSFIPEIVEELNSYIAKELNNDKLKALPFAKDLTGYRFLFFIYEDGAPESMKIYHRDMDNINEIIEIGDFFSHFIESPQNWSINRLNLTNSKA